ncbi:MAG: LysR family transcriptional regulator, partial [Betaproteobacteria bacterium]|nr:LysR family transcriptional regulator [Betaproteobacteria bacterium]
DTFLDLLETGSFSRTAERLQISQSTASGRIRRLEEQLGGALFVRGRSGAEATAAARRFAAHAHSLRHVWASARRECRAFAGGAEGLRIAGQVSLLETFLTGWTADLRRHHPRSVFYFEADYSQQMTLDMAAGGLDIAVVYTPRYFADIHYEPLFDEDFILTSAPRRTALESVRPEQYIRVHYSAAFDRRHLDLLPHLNDAPLATGLGRIALDFLLLEGGAAYLPAHTATPLIRAKKIYPVKNAPRISHVVYAATPNRRRHLPLVQDALKLLKKRVREQMGR